MFEYTHHVAYVVSGMEDALTVVVGHVFYVTRLALPHAVGYPACLPHVLLGQPNGANGHTVGYEAAHMPRMAAELRRRLGTSGKGRG